jgi:hypothetical protein
VNYLTAATPVAALGVAGWAIETLPPLTVLAALTAIAAAAWSAVVVGTARRADAARRRRDLEFARRHRVHR